MQYRNIVEELEVTRIRKDIERDIEKYFEEKGFSFIEPGLLEDYDDFLNWDLMEDSSKAVKVLGGDSKIYVLRPDITTNILSQIFSKWEGKPPLKLYYNSKIYKNGSRGKVSQKNQMGVESLGDEPFKADGEMVEMAISLMSTLGEPYILELGSSKFLQAVFKEMKLKMDDEVEMKNLISKKNQDALLVKLKSLKLTNKILENIFDMQGDMEQVLELVKSYNITKEMKDALYSLEGIKELFVDKGIKDKIKLDLSMVADLDYYDGIIFKGYCISAPSKILSGGRYDKSTAKYGRKVAAIGFMIDMDLVTEISIKEGR